MMRATAYIFAVIIGAAAGSALAVACTGEDDSSTPAVVAIAEPGETYDAGAGVTYTCEPGESLWARADESGQPVLGDEFPLCADNADDAAELFGVGS